MSIQSEITRPETAKSATAAAIAGKGVTVPDGTMLDGMAALIEAIQAGGTIKLFSGTITPSEDIVDITMNNIQTFCQRLYTQEPGIGEEIDKRIESLKMAKDIEDSMGLQDNYATDEMSMEVDEMFENEDFNPEVDE